MTRVSIITPVFNGAGTIGTAMDSVLGQGEANWEHIIVDDGSNDRTGDTVLSRTDPRVKYFREPKCGRSIARNIGIAHSVGEYLLFLDADDWLLPDSLQEHTCFLDEYPGFGVCVSDGYFCTDKGDRITSLSERRKDISSGRVADRVLVDPAVIGASNAAVIRGSVVKEHGLRFHPGLEVGEDWLFWVQASFVTPFGFIPAMTCAYRWHENSTTLGTKREFRQNQLWIGRKIIMEDPGFNKLSPETRRIFFYQVLTDLLLGKPETQEAVFKSSQFADLSRSARGELFRLAAVEYLLAGEHRRTALRWLEKSRMLAPGSTKNLLVERIAAGSPKLAGSLVRFWRRLQFRKGRESLLDLDAKFRIPNSGF